MLEFCTNHQAKAAHSPGACREMKRSEFCSCPLCRILMKHRATDEENLTSTRVNATDHSGRVSAGIPRGSPGYGTAAAQLLDGSQSQ